MEKEEKSNENLKLNQELLTQLKSQIPALQIKAIRAMEEKGNAAYIPHLLDVLYSTDNEEVFAELDALLKCLKTTKALTFIVIDLLTDKSNNYKHFLLSYIWQSGLDSASYLTKLVEILPGAGYLVHLELLTVIESLDTKPSDEDLAKTIKYLLPLINKSDSDIKILLEEMVKTLQNFMVGEGDVF